MVLLKKIVSYSLILGRARDTAFLTTSLVILILLNCGPTDRFNNTQYTTEERISQHNNKSTESTQIEGQENNRMEITEESIKGI